MADSVSLGSTRHVGGRTRFRHRHPLPLSLRLRTWLRRPWLDAAIARGVQRPGDQGLALRQAELVGVRERRRLAARLEGILAPAARPTWPTSALPIDRQAVAAATPLLTELIHRLRSPDPVEARGMVLVWRLLTDPGSPIYAPSPAVAGDPDRLWYESLSLLFALRPLVGPTTP